MADPCRQQVVDAAKGRLLTVPALETAGAYKSPNVESNRIEPLDEEDLPSLVLFEGDERVIELFTAEDTYDFSFAVQGAVKGTDDAAKAAANVLRANVLAALLADRTLGGKVRMLEAIAPGDFIGVDYKVDATGFLLAFHAQYATREGDPYTFTP